MKRLICSIVIALVVVSGSYGVYSSMLWENQPHLAQRHWLEKLFQTKGFTVGWTKSEVSIESFFLTKNESSKPEVYEQNFRALQISNIIQFYERRDSSIFFIFGKRVSILEQNKGEKAVVVSLVIPKTGQVSFALKGGGEFVLGETKEILELFPYQEVRSLRTRPLKILYASWVISGLVLLWGFIGGIKRERRLARIRVPVTRIPIVTGTSKKPKKEPTLLTSPPSDNSQTRRVVLLAKLASLIEESKDPGQKEELRALYEKMNKEKRISLIHYAVLVRVPGILYPENQVNEESEEIQNDSDVSGEAPERQGSLELIGFQEIGDFIPQDFLPCAKRILLFMLQPGKRMPYMGEHRILHVRMQRILCKSGEVSHEEFVRAYQWFLKQGVILQVDTHGADGSCSINPHAKQAKTPEGEKIVGILIRTRQEMVRR